MGIDPGDMKDWLWKNVAINGITVGRVVAVIAGRAGGEAVGFEVRCEDGRHRYLPRAAARIEGEVVAIDSSLALLEPEQLEFYRSRGVAIRSKQEPAA